MLVVIIIIFNMMYVCMASTTKCHSQQQSGSLRDYFVFFTRHGEMMKGEVHVDVQIIWLPIIMAGMAARGDPQMPPSTEHVWSPSSLVSMTLMLSICHGLLRHWI